MASFPSRSRGFFETTDRIPRTLERHTFPETGHCCLGVWEEWLVTEPHCSFAKYLNGPVRSYVLAQMLHEQNPTAWRFGDRSHGGQGVLEAYADVLQLTPDFALVEAYLATLSQPWPKGHWLCPCGSARSIRHCHRDRLTELHARIPPAMAARMLHRLRQTAAS